LKQGVQGPGSVNRAAMMWVAGTIGVVAIGSTVFLGYMAMQALVFMLEIASKITEEMR
jgi:uncharacterized membrane protein YhiD involved in acid resistance